MVSTARIRKAVIGAIVGRAACAPERTKEIEGEIEREYVRERKRRMVESARESKHNKINRVNKMVRVLEGTCSADE